MKFGFRSVALSTTKAARNCVLAKEEVQLCTSKDVGYGCRSNSSNSVDRQTDSSRNGRWSGVTGAAADTAVESDAARAQ